MDQIRLKLRRARQHLAELKSSLDAFDQGSLGIRYTNGTALLQIVRAPDPELVVLASEVAHHARSVLEQLVTMLVVAEGGRPESHRGSFPIADDSDAYFRAQPGRSASYRDVALHGVAEEARQVIDRVQPFQIADVEGHPLRLLRGLSNDEKHLLGHPLSVMMRGFALIYFDHAGNTIQVFSDQDGDAGHRLVGRTGLQDGDDLWELVPEHTCKAVAQELAKKGVTIEDPRRQLRLYPRLAVGFAGTRAFAIYPELERILDFVEFEVVAALAPFITGHD